MIDLTRWVSIINVGLGLALIAFLLTMIFWVKFPDLPSEKKREE